MKQADIVFHRLINQQILRTRFLAPADLVHWMGAMQAQDYPMAKWAVGLRVARPDQAGVEKALADGKIIRTHILRPTWHFVASKDIYWMLELAAPQIRVGVRARHKALELTEALITQSNSIFEKATAGGKCLTREELIAHLTKAKIGALNNRAIHFLLRSELDGVLCSGPDRGNKRTYALLRERVPEGKTLTREEALAKLALTYFKSHGPATLQDFTWWSGLRTKDSTIGLQSLDKTLVSSKVGGNTYWFDPESTPSGSRKMNIYLLPAFDEYLISYKDRRATLPSGDHSSAISQNGIFWPIIIVEGRTKGIWKWSTRKDKLIISARYFDKPSYQVKFRTEEAAGKLALFLGRKIEMEFI